MGAIGRVELLQDPGDVGLDGRLGQDEALDALMSSFARLFSGLRDPARPVLTGLLLGPTGVGKTETARALSMAFFGSDDGVRGRAKSLCERADGPDAVRVSHAAHSTSAALGGHDHQAGADAAGKAGGNVSGGYRMSVPRLWSPLWG